MSWRTTVTTVQAYNLEVAAYPLVKATWQLVFGVYHVGSSITRKDWRDVDLRLIMDDAKFDALLGKRYSHLHMLTECSYIRMAVYKIWIAYRFSVSTTEGGKRGVSDQARQPSERRWHIAHAL